MSYLQGIVTSADSERFMEGDRLAGRWLILAGTARGLIQAS
jgi:hypothetical protein